MAGGAGESAVFFQPGRRVRVALPLVDGATPFQEWARVRHLQNDMVEVELSRDSLPQQVSLEPGVSVKLGIIENQEVLGCNGAIVAWKGDHRLVLRLLDHPVRFEPREYFRQNLELALDYRLPPSQFPQDIKEHWRQSRWAMEFAAQEPEPGESEELRLLREEINSRLQRRKSAPPVAANISGGGIRLNLGEKFRPGMLVEMGIYLPQPEKVLEVVGEVVQVTVSAGKDHFNTAFRYRFIEEADRDRLIGYLASHQLKELSQRPQKVTQRRALPAHDKKLMYLRIVLGILTLAGLLSYEVRSIVASRGRGEKHEIARVFEAGILDFLRQRKSPPP